MREHDDYERSAVRWLGRCAFEARGAAIEYVQSASQRPMRCRIEPNAAMEQLAAVCARCGLA